MVVRLEPLAFLLMSFLGVIGLATIFFSLKGKAYLRKNPHLASDEKRYTSRKLTRRLINGILMTIVGAMLFWSYVSGNENRASSTRLHPDPPKVVAPNDESSSQGDGKNQEKKNPRQNRELNPQLNPDIAAPIEGIGKENRQKDQEEDRAFVRFYILFWMTILLLVFLIVAIAIVDFWAIRRYAMSQFRQLQNDQRRLLERDLALYKQEQQQKQRDRRGGFERK